MRSCRVSKRRPHNPVPTFSATRVDALVAGSADGFPQGARMTSGRAGDPLRRLGLAPYVFGIAARRSAITLRAMTMWPANAAATITVGSQTKGK